MSWIYYLLEANLYLAAFYLVYYVVLRKETYYQLNRAYLLSACVIAFIIPLLQIGSLKHYAPPPPPPMAPINMELPQTAVVHISAPLVTHYVWTSADYYLLCYAVISAVMLVGFAARLFVLIRLSQKAQRLNNTGFYLVEIDDDNNAFSFFKYLFIDPKLSGSDTILQHELVHIRQKHSLDIIFLELFKIVNWFNPAVYLLKNSIKELHEFIADQETARQQQGINEYTDFLISNAYGFVPNTLTNNFFNKNLLRSRIMMLHQKRSGSLARLKYLVTIPLCAGLLCASTLAFTKDYKVYDIAPNKAVIKTAGSQTKATTHDTLPPPPPPAPPKGKYIGTKLLPPPPPHAPTPVKVTFLPLVRHIRENTAYTKDALDNKVNTSAILDFKLDAAGKIEDIKVEQSAGHGLDEAVIRSMKNFTRPLHDKAGEYKIGVNFMYVEKSDMPRIERKIAMQSNFVAEFVVTSKPMTDQVRFPPPMAKPDGKLQPPPKPKVDQIRFPPPVVKPDAKLPPPPKPKVDRVRFPPPIVKPDTGARAYADFYQQLQKWVRWPTEARDKNIQGKVFAVFNIGADHRVTNVQILRGLSDIQNAEVIRSLNITAVPPGMKPGINYTIPVSYVLIDQKTDKYIESGIYVAVSPLPVVKPTGFPTVSLNEVVIAAYK